MRATYHRNDGIRPLLVGYHLIEERLHGHVKTRKKRVWFLEFCRYLRSLHPQDVRIAIICDNFSPHLTTKKDTRVGDWAQANNVEIACTPTNSSRLNCIEAQFAAPRYVTLNGTDHRSHKEQASMLLATVLERREDTAEQVQVGGARRGDPDRDVGRLQPTGEEPDPGLGGQR